MTRSAARWTGLGSGVLAIVLSLVFLFANPYQPASFAKAGLWMAIIPGLGIIGLAAVLATIAEARRALMILCILSLVPWGAYLLLMTPGVFR